MKCDSIFTNNTIKLEVTKYEMFPDLVQVMQFNLDCISWIKCFLHIDHHVVWFIKLKTECGHHTLVLIPKCWCGEIWLASCYGEGHNTADILSCVIWDVWIKNYNWSEILTVESCWKSFLLSLRVFTDADCWVMLKIFLLFLMYFRFTWKLFELL